MKFEIKIDSREGLVESLFFIFGSLFSGEKWGHLISDHEFSKIGQGCFFLDKGFWIICDIISFFHYVWSKVNVNKASEAKIYFY